MPGETDAKSDASKYVLPTAKELIELLDLLGEAHRSNSAGDAAAFEQAILELVPPGTYRGYLDDGPEISDVRLMLIWRKRCGANIYTFSASLEVLGKRTVVEVDLIEFLGEVCRTQYPLERQYTGRRFWVPSH